MSICMTPEEYYNTFVSGNYEDFKDHSGCVRRAFNAAVAASHLADHCYNFYSRNNASKIAHYKGIGEYIEHISQCTQGAFIDIRSIANAYKHLYESPKMEKFSTISSAGTIEAIPIKDEDVQEIYQNFIYEPSSSDAVFYTTKKGEHKEFILTLKTVIDYWGENLP